MLLFSIRHPFPLRESIAGFIFAYALDVLSKSFGVFHGT